MTTLQIRNMVQPFQKGVSLLDQARPIAGILAEISELLEQSRQVASPKRAGEAEEVDYEIVDEAADESDEGQDSE